MAEFTFDALASSGQRSQGTLTANSEREVMAMLDEYTAEVVRDTAGLWSHWPDETDDRNNE